MFWIVSAIVLVPAFFEIYGIILLKDKKDKKTLGGVFITIGFLLHLIGSLFLVL